MENSLNVLVKMIYLGAINGPIGRNGLKERGIVLPAKNGGNSIDFLVAKSGGPLLLQRYSGA